MELPIDVHRLHLQLLAMLPGGDRFEGSLGALGPVSRRSRVFIRILLMRGLKWLGISSPTPLSGRSCCTLSNIRGIFLGIVAGKDWMEGKKHW